VSATTAALLGTLATVVVAIAGYVFNWKTSAGDREAARQLAQDAHEHGMVARRSDRAYTERREAYRLLLAWALIRMQQLELTEPVVTWTGMPEPPAGPSAEMYREIRVALAAFGSPAVDTAFADFLQAYHDFSVAVGTLRAIRDQAGGGGVDLTGPHARLEEKRTAAHAEFDRLIGLVKDELGSL
jgi:hypothetical protein